MVAIALIATGAIAAEDPTGYPYFMQNARTRPIIEFDWGWSNGACGRAAYGVRDAVYYPIHRVWGNSETFKFFRVGEGGVVDPDPIVLYRSRNSDSIPSPYSFTLELATSSRRFSRCHHASEGQTYPSPIDIPRGVYHVLHIDSVMPTFGYVYENVDLSAPVNTSETFISIRSPVSNTEIPAMNGRIWTTFAYSGPSRNGLPSNKRPITITVSNQTYVCAFSLTLYDYFTNDSPLLMYSSDSVTDAIGAPSVGNCTLDYGGTYDFLYTWFTYAIDDPEATPYPGVPGVVENVRLVYQGTAPLLNIGTSRRISDVVATETLVTDNGNYIRSIARIVGGYILNVMSETLYVMNPADLTQYRTTDLSLVDGLGAGPGVYEPFGYFNYFGVTFQSATYPYAMQLALFDRDTLVFDEAATFALHNMILAAGCDVSTTSSYPFWVMFKFVNLNPERVHLDIQSGSYTILFGKNESGISVIGSQMGNGVSTCSGGQWFYGVGDKVYCMMDSKILERDINTFRTAVVYDPALPDGKRLSYNHMVMMDGKFYSRGVEYNSGPPEAPMDDLATMVGLVWDSEWNLIGRHTYGPFPRLGDSQTFTTTKALLAVAGSNRMIEYDFNGFPGEVDTEFRLLPPRQQEDSFRFTSVQYFDRVAILNNSMLVTVETVSDGTHGYTIVSTAGINAGVYPILMRSPIPNANGDGDALPVYALMSSMPEANSTRISFAATDGSVYTYALPDDPVLIGSLGDLVQTSLLNLINSTLAVGGVIPQGRHSAKSHGMSLQGLSEQALGDLAQVTYIPLVDGTYNVTLRYVDGTTGKVVVSTVNNVQIVNVAQDGTSPSCSGRGTRSTGLCNCNAGAYGPICADTIEECSRTICRYDQTGRTCTPTINGVLRCQNSTCGPHYIQNASAACVCAPGMMGLNCATPVPCNGHGTLESDNTCTCSAGRYGPACDLSHTECNAQICGSGFVCEPTVAGVTRCLAAPEGLQPCLPCTGLVHAICDASIGVCRCADGYYGNTCASSLVTCVATQCSTAGETCRPNRKVGESVCMNNATLSTAPTYVRTGCNNNGVTLSNATACTCFEGYFGPGCNMTASACRRAHCTVAPNTACGSTVNGVVNCVPPPAAESDKWVMQENTFIWTAFVIAAGGVVVGAIVAAVKFTRSRPYVPL